MSRPPEIGDHVWWVVDGNTVIDGYVTQSFGHKVDIAKTDAQQWLRVDGPGVEESPKGWSDRASANGLYVDVPTIWLVRGLRGWRWVPRELRPEVKPGDVIERTYEDGVTVRRLVVRRGQTGRESTHLPPHENFVDYPVWDLDAAKAITGLDGWRWIPAGWPGEPRGATP